MVKEVVLLIHQGRSRPSSRGSGREIARTEIMIRTISVRQSGSGSDETQTQIKMGTDTDRAASMGRRRVWVAVVQTREAEGMAATSTTLPPFDSARWAWGRSLAAPSWRWAKGTL